MQDKLIIGPYETFGAILGIGSQKITISRGIEDMGVFMEDINDGRYLPFEGLEINDKMKWEFTVDKDIAKNISDVILTLKLTANSL